MRGGWIAWLLAIGGHALNTAFIHHKMYFVRYLQIASLLFVCAGNTAAQLMLDAAMPTQEDHAYNASRHNVCRQCTTGAQQNEGVCSQSQHQCTTDCQAGASNFLCTA